MTKRKDSLPPYSLWNCKEARLQISIEFSMRNPFPIKLIGRRIEIIQLKEALKDATLAIKMIHRQRINQY